ncbi:MAG: hypothetical protein WC100_02025 [Sterolibacterium sp.]
MTFLVLLVLAILLVLAVRSFSRYRQEQRALNDGLRQAVTQRGWRYEDRPVRGVETRIRGERDGVTWTLEQHNPAAADDLTTPTWVWLEDATLCGDIELMLLDPLSADAMRGALGEAVIRIAEKSLEQIGGSGTNLRQFFERARESILLDSTLQARFKVLTLDAGFSKHLLDPAAEQALLEWPDARVTVQASRHNIILRLTCAELDTDDLRRLVDLGTLLTLNVRRAAPLS